MVDLKSIDKLQWLGLSRVAKNLTNIEPEIRLLRQLIPTVGTFGFPTVFEIYQNHLDTGYDYDGDGTDEGINTYSSHKLYLEDLGFKTKEAERFNTKITQSFSNFSEYQDVVVNTANSFGDLKSAFETQSEVRGGGKDDKGRSTSGIIFHEQDGVSKDGVSIPAGTTEIYGKEIHFSSTSAPDNTSSSDSGSLSNLNFKNISANTTTPNPGQTVEISCDVENNSSKTSEYTIPLYENSSKKTGITVQVGASGTASDTGQVSFEVTKNKYGIWEYSIGTSDTIIINWTPIWS